MIYFDNCSTTHKKPLSVIRAVKKGIKKLNFNPGRAGYKKAIEANLRVFNLRETASNFFNCPNPSDVIITKSCTESLNIALRSNIKKGGHIISTIFEHNSVLRTLEYLKNNYDISYTLLKPNTNGKISLENFSKEIRQNTYLIVVNHISNVTGSIQDIKSIGDFCYKKKLTFIVDGAQSAGHETIDMKEMHINYLAIAGHKGVFGPQGIGLLLCNNAKPIPLIYGGTGTYSSSIIQPIDTPEGIESGTMSMSNILGLEAGIRFTSKKLQKIKNKTNVLSNYIYDNLAKITNITIYSQKDTRGVISFNIHNASSNEISNELDKHNIATRSGLHCAPMVHNYYGTTEIGMVRIGISYYNSFRQAKKLIHVIKKISNKYS